MMPFAATWMDLAIIVLSEVNHKEKDKYYMISLICRIQNTTQMKLTYETGSQTWRTDFWLPRRRRIGEAWIRNLGLADANYCI